MLNGPVGPVRRELGPVAIFATIYHLIVIQLSVSWCAPDSSHSFRYHSTMSDLTELLACPRCDSALDARKDGWQSRGSKVHYPLLGGVPFLFAEPGVALDEWRGRYHARLQEIAHEAAALERAAAAPGLHSATSARLAHMRTALAQHGDELKALLQPLDVTRLTADHTTYLALRTRLPSDQGLATYYANLHRDWCWGGEENQRSSELVAAALEGHSIDKMLVLGAGGGRLTYDLHQRFEHALTVGVDFNPLLMLAAQRLSAGDKLELHEFPIAPRATD